MTTEVRRYQIKSGHMDDFVRAWTAGVYPLRKKHGFTVDGAWILDDTKEFLWILSHPGPQSWDEAQDAYYSSPERESLDPDPVQWIAEPRHTFARPVDLL